MSGVIPPFTLQHAFMMCRRKTLLLPVLISMAKVKNKGQGPGFVHEAAMVTSLTFHTPCHTHPKKYLHISQAKYHPLQLS